jgi:hypothetical protein
MELTEERWRIITSLAAIYQKILILRDFTAAILKGVKELSASRIVCYQGWAQDSRRQIDG